MKSIVGRTIKVVVIFLLLVGIIGFVSGYRIATGSMVEDYYKGFETYNIEDGNFVIPYELDSAWKEKIEKTGVTLSKKYFIEEKVKSENTIDTKIRIYMNRDDVNKVSLLDGKMPESRDEIAIDRIYAERNDIRIGDTLPVGTQELTVSGYVALPDYSGLFSNKSDKMFNSSEFGVALLTEDGFNRFDVADIQYCYAWKNGNTDQTENIKKVLYDNTSIIDFVPRDQNQGINFAGVDMESDREILTVYVFVFVAIIGLCWANIRGKRMLKECQKDGMKWIIETMKMPDLITLLASIVANITGYFYFQYLGAKLYHSSYSLRPYVKSKDFGSLILTTVAPVLIMVVVQFVTLFWKLRSEQAHRAAVNGKTSDNVKVKGMTSKSEKYSYFCVMFHNAVTSIVLFVGICILNVVLLFSLMMPSVFVHNEKVIPKNKIAEYQYVLKKPAKTLTEGAEPFALNKLSTANEISEEVNVYGIVDNSSYVENDFSSNKIYVTNGYADKYDIQVGDTVTLKEQYGSQQYEFKVDGIYYCPSGLGVFMDIDTFRSQFNCEEEYFNAYFSNKEIEDIDKADIITTITEKDLMKFTYQMKFFMGSIFSMVSIVAGVLYVLLIYLVGKHIMDKNHREIIDIRKLNYEKKELFKLCLVSVSIVAGIAAGIGGILSVFAMKSIYRGFMADYSGWLTYCLKPSSVEIMIIIEIAGYVVAMLLLGNKNRHD